MNNKPASAQRCPGCPPRPAAAAVPTGHSGASSGGWCAPWRLPARLAPFIAGSLLAAEAAMAQTSPEELARLLEEGRAEQAYQLALEERAELEGEIAFDYYYGVAAVESGRVNEGAFALERVVMRRPGFAEARLQLGRAYFLMGDDRRAGEQFDAVMAQQPPAPVEAAVEQYRAAMRERADRYRTVVTGYVAGGLGSDSNVNSATSEDTIDTVLGPVALAASGQERSDTFLRAAGGVELRRPVSAGASGFVSADLDSRSHADEDEFDTLRLDLRAGAVFHGERLQTRVSARAQRFDLDGEEYQSLLGLRVNALYRWSARTALIGGLQVNEIDNDASDIRDSTLTIASAGVTRAWSGAWRPVGSVSVFAGTEDPDDDSTAAEAATERDLHGINAALRLQLAPAWQAGLRAQYRRSEYGAEFVILGETREEDYTELEVTLDWQPSARWQLGPRLLVAENDANTDLYQYDRTVFELRARYNFY
jgi:tetratricopeptide (TPR) repeat protein